MCTTESLKVTVSPSCDRAIFFNEFAQIFSDIFALFLAQNFKTKILTAQKNILLECLVYYLLSSIGFHYIILFSVTYSNKTPLRRN